MFTVVYFNYKCNLRRIEVETEDEVIAWAFEQDLGCGSEDIMKIISVE